jgi:hypothetical protein
MLHASDTLIEDCAICAALARHVGVNIRSPDVRIVRVLFQRGAVQAVSGLRRTTDFTYTFAICERLTPR